MQNTLFHYIFLCDTTTIFSDLDLTLTIWSPQGMTICSCDCFRLAICIWFRSNYVENSYCYFICIAHFNSLTYFIQVMDQEYIQGPCSMLYVWMPRSSMKQICLDFSCLQTVMATTFSANIMIGQNCKLNSWLTIYHTWWLNRYSIHLECGTGCNTTTHVS